MKIFRFTLPLLAGLLCCACSGGPGAPEDTFEVTIHNQLEDYTPDGYLFTPSTQSFLRGEHWLDNIATATIAVNDDLSSSIEFRTAEPADQDRYFRVRNLPLDQLVPRLHYPLTGEFDDFDRFNLMMAEYSRNGLSMPFADDADQITHFETNLENGIPWKLDDDYDFRANPLYKPVRFSVVNNCLQPGLWELSASDKTGEVYHGWFSFPQDRYLGLVSRVNGVTTEEVGQALTWKDNDHTVLDLERLRTVKRPISREVAAVIDEPISYSSQGSRRKLSKGFVTCKRDSVFDRPAFLSDLLNRETKMCEFIPPGKYSLGKRVSFDFASLGRPEAVNVREVSPRTCYRYNEGDCGDDGMQYIEIEFELPDGERLLLGNLPLNLLVNQEDFSLHGFGVGVLSAGGFAERRRFLIDRGFRPAFAYLARVDEDGHYRAQNSHLRGLEQVFIRSFPNADTPHWDITFTSYERITDIVKYRVPIPRELAPAQLAHTADYITPVYFSYRDDNLR